jgi:predicted metal-dependent phosphoesterase TrpH
MIKCDFHIHSNYSFDSLAKHKDIVDIAIRRGLQCIAIADHGNMTGSIEATKYARNLNLPILIIPSEEVKSKQGDILALNIKEPIPNGLPALETISRIKQQNGTVIIPHPFGSLCSFHYDLEKLLDRIDGIEILNASVFWGNGKAKRFAQKHSLAFTVGSDAHFSNQFIGKVWLDLPFDYSPTLTADYVMQAIKSKLGTPGGHQANFFEAALDHSLRSLTKLKVFVKK